MGEYLEGARPQRLIPTSLDEEHRLRHSVVGHGGGPAKGSEAQQAAPVPVVALHWPDVALDHILQDMPVSPFE